MNLELKKCTMDDLETLRDFSEALYYETFKGMCNEKDMEAYLKKLFIKKK